VLIEGDFPKDLVDFLRATLLFDDLPTCVIVFRRHLQMLDIELQDGIEDGIDGKVPTIDLPDFQFSGGFLVQNGIRNEFGSMKGVVVPAQSIDLHLIEVTEGANSTQTISAKREVAYREFALIARV